MLRLFIFSLLFLAIDLYVFKGFYLLMSSINLNLKIAINSLFWILNIVLIYHFITIFSNWHKIRVERAEYVSFWSSIFFTVLVAKLSFLTFHLIDDIFYYLKHSLSLFFSNSIELDKNYSSRLLLITKFGLAISTILLVSFTYGVTKGKYAFKIMREKISYKNLPKSFTGFKIIQISDLHLGSFLTNFQEIKKAIDIINKQKPDLIVFTGDMVNVHSDEAEPWIDIFSKLEAKVGKYSIFGNHDYCDYGNYNKEEKLKSIKRLKEIHKEMGFILLEDESVYIEKNNEQIIIAGMHNWGKDFHRVGSLENTLKGLKDGDFKILLSHDPSLWEKKIMNKLNIELTLSGHTHGMQFGIKIPFFKTWSPVKYRYKRWGGLYKENDSYIYVNRGFGVLGFPGRVGMKPEITEITLER